jgi:secondary thiamine-phosphate synthase enzyme
LSQERPLSYEELSSRLPEKNRFSFAIFLYNYFMRRIQIKTTQRCEAVDITTTLKNYVHDLYADSGILTVHCPHTTAGITVNENADPNVMKDVVAFLGKTIPKDAGFSHAEGNSDAHIKASLLNSSQAFIVEDGKIQLGQWQGIYFMEMDGPRDREVWLKFMEERQR